MTEPKREPFAEPFVFFSSFGARAIRIASSLLDRDGNNIDGKIKAINAAFNARVDEEIKKAVEEFRERAAKLAENCLSKDGEAIGFAIRCLPTEPEAK